MYLFPFLLSIPSILHLSNFLQYFSFAILTKVNFFSFHLWQPLRMLLSTFPPEFTLQPHSFYQAKRNLLSKAEDMPCAWYHLQFHHWEDNSLPFKLHHSPFLCPSSFLSKPPSLSPSDLIFLYLSNCRCCYGFIIIIIDTKIYFSYKLISFLRTRSTHSSLCIYRVPIRQ